MVGRLKDAMLRYSSSGYMSMKTLKDIVTQDPDMRLITILDTTKEERIRLQQAIRSLPVVENTVEKKPGIEVTIL